MQKQPKKDPNLEILSAFLTKTLKEKQIANLMYHLNQQNRNKILSNLANLGAIDLMDLVEPERFQKLMATIDEIGGKLNLNVQIADYSELTNNNYPPTPEIEQPSIDQTLKLERSALYALVEMGYIDKKELAAAYKQLKLLRGE